MVIENLCLMLYTFFFKVKDLENVVQKLEKNDKKHIVLKIFLKIETGHVLKMFLNFGQI